MTACPSPPLRRQMREEISQTLKDDQVDAPPTSLSKRTDLWCNAPSAHQSELSSCPARHCPSSSNQLHRHHRQATYIVYPTRSREEAIPSFPTSQVLKMWRSVLRKRAACNVRARRSTQRNFSSQPTSFELPPVRVLRPTLWCFGAAGLIYIGCAAYEVRKDVELVKRVRKGNGGKFSSNDFAAVDFFGNQYRIQRIISDPGLRFPDFDNLDQQFQSMSGPTKMIGTAMALNLTLYPLGRVLPALQTRIWHIPAVSPNYTLLTSMFGHAGLLHLGLNTYVLANFAQPVARTRTFEGSGSHLTAFYLSSGIFASLAHHLTSIWPNPASRVVPALGASGGIMALLSAFALSYPQAGIGILFIPGSLPAPQALALLSLFELYGLFRGYGFRLAHGAHLGGLLVGAAYIQFDGRKYVWNPTRRFVHAQMCRLNMV